MAEPSYEELQQRVEDLEKLVKPYYEPPSGTEMSFPVERLGITQTQFQQMNLPNGDGVIVTDDGENSHLLRDHESSAETNSRNTLILKVAENTGRAEAVLAGFYHVLHEDVELEFPPVSSTTTYYVCLTYDPRKFRDPNGPVSLEVYTDTPPDTDGQKHLILHTVTRRPNELLTSAQRELYRQMITPVITVSRGEAGLPDSTQVPYSTLGILRSRTSGGKVVPGTGQIYEARGIHGWHKLLGAEWEDEIADLRSALTPGPWRSCGVFDNQGWSGSAYVRKKIDGIDLRFNIQRGTHTGAANIAQINLPADLAIGGNIFYGVVMTTSGPRNYRVGHAGSGRHAGLQGGSERPSWTRGNLFIPNYYLRNP